MSQLTYDSAEKKPMIFISYAHDDALMVRKFYEYLEEQGYLLWFDQTRIEAGDNFNAAIDQNLKTCGLVLVFLSKRYVEKKYCQLEFNIAIDNKRNIITVCLDDVHKDYNPSASYMFNRYAGHNVLAYGHGIHSEEVFLEVCKQLCGSTLFRYASMTDAERMESGMRLDISEALLDRLEVHRQTVYKTSGNYFLDEIHAELFSQLKEDDFRIVYRDANRKEVPLYNYLSDHPNRHLLLVGNGGMGKTVSMLRTCEYLLKKGIPAVYIPLRNIDFQQDTLISYIQRVVCLNQGYLNELMIHAQTAYHEQPNLVLLLDGVNEVPKTLMQKMIRSQLMKEILPTWRGTQIIMSSRYDFRASESLEKDVHVLYMQNLGEYQIHCYIEKCGLPAVQDKKILQLLGNPLLLSLYTNAERYREQYDLIAGMELEALPDTAGKIIGNFLKTQLFRALKEIHVRLPEYLVVLEYVLPAIAVFMITEDRYSINGAELDELLDDLEDDRTRFQWYERDRLRKIMRSLELEGFRWDSMRLLNLSVHGLSFLNRAGEDSYEFLHQNLRDYFASYYLANEMRAIVTKPERMKNQDLYLGKYEYADDIIKLVSDITAEEKAAPFCQENQWVFPGKCDGKTPSEYSAAEQMLPLLRGMEGEPIRTIVWNLLRIMRNGRKNCLAWCDFSGLDLRKCRMNNCQFVVWHREQVFASRFDEAWLEPAFLLNEGHESDVQAICTDYADLIFSGDAEGVVRIYDCSRNEWIRTIRLRDDAVVDLAWNPVSSSLAILYANAVYMYSLHEDRGILCGTNEDRSKQYRYVRFAGDSLQVSYNFEPLYFYTLDGEMVPCAMDYDVMVRCAKWHPHKMEHIRGYMFQMISANYLDEETGQWQQHPAFAQKKERINRMRKEKKIPLLKRYYLRLKDDGVNCDDNIQCLCYHPDGERFLVVINHYILEYDNHTMSLLQRKNLKKRVICACYGKNDRVIVGCENAIVVLAGDFSKQFEVPGGVTGQVLNIHADPSGEGYYLYSRNGEIKKMDEQLCVQRIRRYSDGSGTPIWGKDRLTQERQMLFLPGKQYPYGSRFSFETGDACALGWRYEVLDQSEFLDDYDQKVYKLSTSVMTVDKNPPYKKTVFVNYTGICIFACSFHGIRGGMSKPDYLQILKKNGGMVDECT